MLRDKLSSGACILLKVVDALIAGSNPADRGAKQIGIARAN
jgi:hypothetical protein